MKGKEKVRPNQTLSRKDRMRFEPNLIITLLILPTKIKDKSACETHIARVYLKLTSLVYSIHSIYWKDHGNRSKFDHVVRIFVSAASKIKTTEAAEKIGRGSLQ